MLNEHDQQHQGSTHWSMGFGLDMAWPWKMRNRIRKWHVAEHAGYPCAPFPMCFTHESMQEILRTVGARPPETGSKIFSRWEYMGVETVEYDKSGSESAGGAIYSPDTQWGAERLEYHMSQPEMRLWTGDIHSHPGNFGHPSRKSGKALGDLGYVEEVFAQNEIMEYFFIPILTNTATDVITIHPWVCKRGTSVELMIAEVQICESDEEFPARIFNPEWEAGLVESTTPETTQTAEEPPIEVSSSVEAARKSCEHTVTTTDTPVSLPQVSEKKTGRGTFPLIYVPTVSPARAIQTYREIQEARAFSDIDLWAFRHLLQDVERAAVYQNRGGLQVYFDDMYGEIVLPPRFPEKPPVIRFDYMEHLYELPSGKWLVRSSESPERRLANACLAVACLLRDKHRKGWR